MGGSVATREMVLFGGSGSGQPFLGDTWTFNGATWHELFPATSPPGRWRGSMAYDPAIRDDLLFGGSDLSRALNDDTWLFNGGQWSKISTSPSPPALCNASMAYDPATGDIVLFGGSDNSLNHLNDHTWTFNGSRWSEEFPWDEPTGPK